MNKREAPLGILAGGLRCQAPFFQDPMAAPTASALPVPGSSALAATHSHPLTALGNMPGNGIVSILYTRKLSEARDRKEMI